MTFGLIIVFESNGVLCAIHFDVGIFAITLYEFNIYILLTTVSDSQCTVKHIFVMITFFGMEERNFISL